MVQLFDLNNNSSAETKKQCNSYDTMQDKFVELSFRSVRRTIPDIYICNLAMADLVHVLGMPFLIHQWARGGEWVLGSTLCTITTSLDSCNQFACCAIMAAMSLDR